MPPSKNTLVIGICGGTGSGKTTITRRIIEVLSESNVNVLEQDHYYRDLPNLPREERVKQNFDHPDSMDTPLLIEHIKQLRAGPAINPPPNISPDYPRAQNVERPEPSPATIVEGILIFDSKPLREL